MSSSDCEHDVGGVERELQLGAVAVFDRDFDLDGAVEREHQRRHFLQREHLGERNFAAGVIEQPRAPAEAVGRQHGEHGAVESRSAERVHSFRDAERSAVDQPSGAVPGGDDLVQSGHGLFAGAGAGRDQQGDREGRSFRASVVANYQGTAAAFEGSLSNEGLLILAALVTVYIVLGVLYESFVHPITILSTLPSAGVGALLALMLFHLDLDIVAIIGIILLIGIVKKNGIMMVDFALEAERKEDKNATDAIYQASLLRFRPIMMTTMAALLSGLRWRSDRASDRSCASRWAWRWSAG